MTARPLQRYHLVDISRGAAALAVLIYHYQHFYFPQAGVDPIAGDSSMLPWHGALWIFYDYGYWAVQFFWIISGFVFAATYIDHPVGGGDFFIRRFARLYPLHFATLILVAVLQFCSSMAVGHEQIYEHNDAYHFTLNLFMASAWGFEKDLSFNGPVWSLSAEVVVYFVFFWSLPRLRRYPALTTAIGVFAPLAMLAQHVASPVVQCAFLFYLGVAVFLLLRKSVTLAIVGAVSALLFVSVAQALPIPVSFQVVVAFIGLVLVTAIIDTTGIYRSGWLKWFGDATYGSYLLHVPLQIAINTTLDFFRINRPEVASNPLCLVAFVGVVFGLAALSFRYFEKPFDQGIRKRYARLGLSARYSGTFIRSADVPGQGTSDIRTDP
ncbi:acyltransferase family protein [Mesorhizobium helmanticense]|uniref:Acyltransferase 3 domain-containing protein n=1 Tax=Mesorhizobium helmanticense TaxID=1776423 RepID=A0A2T4IPQ0_9HYPH|nr:acyltransferase [Mesorhizobium helmanticense]PTE07573.1 hypothetical protein C9427_26000 [Mesorhizobium helmanticense]